MHKLLDKDGAQHLVDKFLSDQGLQDNKLDEIEEKFDDLYSIVGIEHYGIKIDKNNPDTSARIVYTHDCENYTPARMNYTNGVFEIGSWGNAFFMKNNYPAMCNFYGVEQYKLDKNDHSLKEDGTSSDVADETYNGNAMSVFDCHIWMKFWEDDNYQYLEVSNYKLDDDFKDYPYVRADGSKADKLYYPMYPGYKDSNNRLRSISGVKAPGSTTTAQEVQYASNCGTNWDIGDWSHYLWLHSLMLLISKNFNSQMAFGNGNMLGTSIEANIKTNGLLNASGQFFGYNTSSDSMKAFYQENVFANRWQRLLGFYNDKGTYKIKMVPPYTYDETFEGYTTVSSPAVPSPDNWLKDLSFDSSYGLVPKTGGGSAATYVGDNFYANNSQVDLLLAGGYFGNGAGCGSWHLRMNSRASYSSWSVGASSYLTEPIHFDLNTIYGSSPIYFEQDNYAQPLADYTILGNSYQDGTPSPDMPVEVVGCGIWDETQQSYKLPLTVNGTEYPIYLGQVPTTRRIKKLVLDGTEEWTEITAGLYRIMVNGYLRIAYIQVGMSSHFNGGYAIDSVPSAKSDELTFLVSDSGNNYVYLSSWYLTTADFKSYLAQQYANGTPVTIWYILAEPETGIVNEPLHRIGDYADTISFAQAPITLPTITPTPGSNTLSVDTALQPSQVSITGHIKEISQ